MPTTRRSSITHPCAVIVPAPAVLAGLLVLTAVRADAQTVGTVRGTISNAASGAPISDVQVSIVGTRRGAITNETGRYTITGAPAGPVTLRAQKVGYSPMQMAVTVGGSGIVTADFRLTTVAVALDQVVVTGTPGATSKRVLGNTVATVQAAQVTAVAPVPNVTELLQGRASGVNVLTTSGAVGTSAQIRIRGASSLSGNTQPVIYIDGIRMQGGAQSSFDNSGATVQATSALDAIDPNDIESVEVIKGPAAATLYGADAASGVIQIITKKGRLGQQSAEWNAKAEGGSIDWALPRPKTYWYCTDANIANASLYPACAALGANPTTRMLVNDPFNVSGALRTGNTRTYTLGARGGSDRFAYYFAGGHDGENGVLYNNYFTRNNGRANFQANVLANLTVGVNANFVRTDAREPLSDNSSNSVLRNGYRDRPSGPWPWQREFRGFGPDLANQYDNEVQTERYILGTTVNYQPWGWFQNRLNAGVDVNNQRASQFYGIDSTGRAPWGATFANGYVAYLLPVAHQWTVDYAGTATRALPKSLTSATSVGVQYSAYRYESWTTTGTGLVANSLNLVGSAASTTADQSFLEQKSFGTYAQEQIGWRNRLFVTGALRVDNNSAFGSNFKWVTYPKASVSYVVSDEPFFRLPHVDELKLRGAWGAAGNAPQPFSAVRAYAATTSVVGDVAVNSIQPQTYGNANLRAERGEEVELGFDLSALRGRLGAEFTYYNKKTKDALVTVPAPPSTGFVGFGSAAGTYLANLGEIANAGVELTLRGTPYSRPNATWESVLNLSTNHNKLVTFGTGFNTITFGTFAQNQEFAAGYPLGAYWATDVARDASGAPVLTNGKVTLDPKLRYLGPSQPTREISLANTVTLFKNVRLYAYLDYKGGGYLFDGIKYVNDRLDLNTYAVNDPNGDAVQKQVLESGATKPDIVRSDFIKLRELSIGYTLPRALTSRLRGTTATVNLAARNLALWKLKGYPGIDPEVEFYSGVGATPGTAATPTAIFDRTDYASIPMLRRLVTSINLTF